ncbi:hypothetical protein AYI70_g562 [Smittium culicis]|uniref:Uncharacterized protein n=1 Tax=Smittium culicis TaxID=133412 RepID=A0A1R1YGC6_9FUNG|nr:hypothetical protein AYI70_g562 [Smittium culicis]
MLNLFFVAVIIFTPTFAEEQRNGYVDEKSSICHCVNPENLKHSVSKSLRKFYSNFKKKSKGDSTKLPNGSCNKKCSGGKILVGFDMTIKELGYTNYDLLKLFYSIKKKIPGSSDIYYINACDSGSDYSESDPKFDDLLSRAKVQKNIKCIQALKKKAKENIFDAKIIGESIDDMREKKEMLYESITAFSYCLEIYNDNNLKLLDVIIYSNVRENYEEINDLINLYDMFDKKLTEIKDYKNKASGESEIAIDTEFDIADNNLANLAKKVVDYFNNLNDRKYARYYRKE